jgi:hypothetical protein
MQLNEQLSAKNGIHLTMDEDAVPMVYPFLTDDDTLRQRLIANRIYVATYWPNIKEWCNGNMIEYKLMTSLVPFPINKNLTCEILNK